ncbi:MAG: right-handed parallel beta-helix repeat-containing protein [Alphaproteobacteria bacterium]|nr:right-handed parallel beta-helix repeat-containing protein [Alphaproteobacteria bacterium]
MTTIDRLTPAAALTSGDLFVVQQGTVVHKATLSQVSAGLQTEIALTQGQILGRVSSGTGAPEAVPLGSNLVMQSGTLAALTTPLNVGALPGGAVPSAGDLVPISQGGINAQVSYGRFMGGIGNAGTVDVSALTVVARGGTTARALADIAADAVAVEAFGARGDGVSDDTAAFAAAIAAGRTLRLAAKTYVVNGQFTIAAANVALLGVPGLSVVKRGVQAGNGAWIAIQGDGFRADGIIFDANGPAVAVESWGVQVAASCLHSDFQRCTFKNAYGGTLGCGLVFLSSDPSLSEHVVRDCAFSNNAAHGLWVEALDGVLIADCRAHDNAAYGIVADFNDATFSKKLRLAQIVGNRAWANQRGIAVGNFNATNAQPPVWGNANPDAIGVLVAGNICHDNTIYGIAVSGSAIAIQGNLLSNNGSGIVGGAGILANAGGSALSGNTITGSSTYGIDCGGSINLDVRANSVSGGLYGINCGGGSAVRVVGNTTQGSTVAGICVANVETDGVGVNFGLASSQTLIEGNWIGMSLGAAGVWLRDGPQTVVVARNHFVGNGPVGNCLWADTDGVSVEGNRHNFVARFACAPVSAGGLQQVVFPDIADAISIPSASTPVQSMVSSRQSQWSGRIGFVRITAGGTGYTHASLALPGGAAASAYIANGQIIGAMVTAGGSGLGAAGSTMAVTITGDGSGAAAVAYVASPLPAERRLAVRCDVPVSFAAGGSQPAQAGWAGGDVAVPAGSETVWTALGGGWKATDGASSATLGGPVRLVSPAEPVGCTSQIGRGAPEGVVTANPGSDWRNLDGGDGATWWVKRGGTGATGWVAIA